MLALNTVPETFRQMRLPYANTDDKDIINLFHMCGTLAASVMSGWLYVDLWALDI